MHASPVSPLISLQWKFKRIFFLFISSNILLFTTTSFQNLISHRLVPLILACREDLKVSVVKELNTAENIVNL